MKNYIGKKVLITTSNRFTAPDGSDYKAVWGTVRAVHSTEDALGFKPNMRHTNWFIEVGNMTIAGCQVLYLVQYDDEPNLGKAESYSVGPGQVYSEYRRLSHIYKAEN